MSICKPFIMTRRCKNGDECEFAHLINEDKSKTNVCYFWATGECKKESNCNFAHPAVFKILDDDGKRKEIEVLKPTERKGKGGNEEPKTEAEKPQQEQGSYGQWDKDKKYNKDRWAGASSKWDGWNSEDYNKEWKEKEWEGEEQPPQKSEVKSEGRIIAPTSAGRTTGKGPVVIPPTRRSQGPIDISFMPPAIVDPEQQYRGRREDEEKQKDKPLKMDIEPRQGYASHSRPIGSGTGSQRKEVATYPNTSRSRIAPRFENLKNEYGKRNESMKEEFKYETTYTKAEDAKKRHDSRDREANYGRQNRAAGRSRSPIAPPKDGSRNARRNEERSPRESDRRWGSSRRREERSHASRWDDHDKGKEYTAKDVERIMKMLDGSSSASRKKFKETVEALERDEKRRSPPR